MNWIEIYICINVFIIGCLFGSFFSLANYRIPRKKDIVFTRSFCPKCNHNLGFWDLIPVLSYIFQGGKCRYCKDKISLRYPLLEVGTGILFLIIYLIFGFSIYFFVAIAISIYLIMLTGCHINKTKMLKDEMNKLHSDKDLSYRKGVFILEILIAAVVMALTVGSSYATYKNSVNDEKLNIAKNVAMFECTKNVEIALGIKYDDLSTFSASTMIDGINYFTNVKVAKYSDSFMTKKDYIKIIEAQTEYMYNGQKYTYQIETIKKRLN